MLTISTIPEALAELEKHTGRVWIDSELFDVATTRGIELHAAPPITAQTTIQEFVIGEGLKEKFRSRPGHAVLAVLFPWQVQQLWISGETATIHPNETKMETEGEYHFFTEPVRVSREQVRIKAHSLGKILDAWSKAQAGRWIVDTAQPGGMRCQNGPNWMFPAVTPAAKNDVRLSVTDQQNNTILKWLRDHDYDPLKIPVPPSGKAGVKKMCRDAVKFSSSSVFNTAWDRLRSDGAIKDEE